MTVSLWLSLLLKEVWVLSENPEWASYPAHTSGHKTVFHHIRVDAHLSQRGGGYPKGALILRSNFSFYISKISPVKTKTIPKGIYFWRFVILFCFKSTEISFVEKDYMVLLWVTHLIGGNFQAINLYWVSVTPIRIESLPSLSGEDIYLSISTID